ncbi:hypothetical protein CDLVIII_2872 [Clostridium sp. DL-VIII]|uniref:DUF2812 domain-containing protein n=1 Tax=Clostridium sp. DL-VIII TaxID=641107 RepID=UPI00023AFBA9|nr:DUF2812 domain-containing protein [Clostridium sp. DL-VIII]EHI99467.1 hypothetical protein CDLVIII_2872 [Clostridium sp. DL-VIII]
MIFNNIKITFLFYSPYECTAVEEYLENMAEDGWLLTGIKGPFFKFKKIKPQKIKYSVDVIGKSSSFDSKKSDELLEYREYCSAAGWNFICQANEIQVFYSEENTEIVSIHTDETEKFKLVFKASLRGRLNELFITIMLIFNASLQLSSNTEYLLSSNLSIFILFITILLIFVDIIKLINFSTWAIRAKLKLKEDDYMPYNTYKVLKRKNAFLIIFSLFSILGILLFTLSADYQKRKLNFIIFAILTAFIIIYPFIKKFINKTRYSKNTRLITNAFIILISILLIISLTTRAILSNVYNNSNYNSISYSNVNLTIDDFINTEIVDKSPDIDCTSSILATRIDYSCGNKDNYFNYMLLESKYPLVVKFYENRLLNWLNSISYNFVKIDTNLPKNIVVYSSSKNKWFILVSNDKVIRIRNHFNNVSDDDFLNTVYLKLFCN